jgi:hypothetical protein
MTNSLSLLWVISLYLFTLYSRFRTDFGYSCAVAYSFYINIKYCRPIDLQFATSGNAEQLAYYDSVTNTGSVGLRVPIDPGIVRSTLCVRDTRVGLATVLVVQISTLCVVSLTLSLEQLKYVILHLVPSTAM